MAMPVAVVSILFMVILFNVWLAFSAQQESEAILSEEVIPVLIEFDEGYRDLYQIIAATKAVLLDEDISYYKSEFKEQSLQLATRINSPQRLIDSGVINNQSQADMQKLQSKFERWFSLHKDFFALTNNYKSYYSKHQPEMNALFTEIRVSLKSIKAAIQVTAHQLDQEQFNHMQDNKLQMELSGLFAILLASFLTWYLSGVIVMPIKRLNTVMQDISSGGDLTIRVDVKTQDEIGQLATSFNQFSEKVHHTITAVVAAAQEVRHEMINIGKVTNSISSGASEQQQESDAVATAVHEMSATSDGVRQHANDAAIASKSASDEANNAKLVLADTVVSIQSLSTEIAQAAEVIDTLEHDVKDISSILDVIRGIADQTNLLALNAAIEAARAGEQGRGFAVVADEVRSLASKTQDSTGEIQTMIEKLQNGAQQAVKVMTSSQTNSEETVLQANIAGNSLDAIVSSINVINDMNIQIATAATEQSQVSEDVNINVQHIAENSHAVVGVVANAEQACVALEGQCAKLDQLVAQFKI